VFFFFFLEIEDRFVKRACSWEAALLQQASYVAGAVFAAALAVAADGLLSSFRKVRHPLTMHKQICLRKYRRGWPGTNYPPVFVIIQPECTSPEHHLL